MPAAWGAPVGRIQAEPGCGDAGHPQQPVGIPGGASPVPVRRSVPHGQLSGHTVSPARRSHRPRPPPGPRGPLQHPQLWLRPPSAGCVAEPRRFVLQLSAWLITIPSLVTADPGPPSLVSCSWNTHPVCPRTGLGRLSWRLRGCGARSRGELQTDRAAMEAGGHTPGPRCRDAQGQRGTQAHGGGDRPEEGGDVRVHTHLRPGRGDGTTPTQAKARGQIDRRTTGAAPGRTDLGSADPGVAKPRMHTGRPPTRQAHAGTRQWRRRRPGSSGDGGGAGGVGGWRGLWAAPSHRCDGARGG